MELRHVRAFLAVADELHFGRAAQRVHVSQPTLSDQLRRLERSMGVRLVDRGPRGVRLTAAGAAFEPAARSALAALETAASDARDVDAQSATVRVGFNYPAGSRILPPLLRRLRADHPRLRPVLTEQRSGPQLDAVSGGRLDVGFVFTAPGAAPGPGVARRTLIRTSLVAVVGAAHPLAGRGRVGFAELTGHRCVLFDRSLSPASYDAIVGGAREAGARLDVVDEIADSTATAVTVSAGDVVGFASRIRVEDQVAYGLRAIALTDPEPVLDICAVWSAGRPERPVESLLGSLARSGPFDRVPDPVVELR